MLAGRNSLILRIHKSFSQRKADQILYTINSIENQVQHYLLIKTFVSILTAIISGVILYIGGFDFVLFSALLIFVLNYIPNFGSIVATTFPVIIGLINDGFSLKVALVAAGLIMTQMIIGNIIEPRITGRNLNISPIVILLSLIFWGYVWGIIGMMLAVPLTSAIKIIFSQIEGLKPIASMISAE
jgi:predicted PurR-regulated permease PerM